MMALTCCHALSITLPTLALLRAAEQEGFVILFGSAVAASDLHTISQTSTHMTWPNWRVLATNEATSRAGNFNSSTLELISSPATSTLECTTSLQQQLKLSDAGRRCTQGAGAAPFSMLHALRQ